MTTRRLLVLVSFAVFGLTAGPAQATCSTTTSDPYPQAVLADSPIAYYRLDEASGTTMCDASNSANNGTYNSSGITYGVTGALSSSADTAVGGDGTPTEVGQSTSDPAGLTGNHAYTLEAWFKSATTSPPTNANTWLVGLGTTGGTGQAVVLSVNPNHGSQLGWGPASAFTIDQFGSDWAWDPTTADVNLWDGNWHYLAVTYTPSNSASASDYIGYVDGHDIGSPDARPYGNAVTNIAASPIILGQGCNTNGCYWLPFEGGLDEVAVYPTALSAARISAHYAAASAQTLTVTRAGGGSGTITSSPAGISCPGACSHVYASGTNVTLSAKPAAGSAFGGWSGACTGTTGCTVTMSAARSVTATFRLLPPNSEITMAKINNNHHSATFSFEAIGKAAGFQCALVKMPQTRPSLSRCSSPKAYKQLKPGNYTFLVRAFNSAGPDPTPAKKSFTIT